LPVVLSREEVQRMYETIRNIKHKTIFLTLYSTGLRVSELTHLKVTDIDSNRMLIRIDQGKNRRDRYVPLVEKLLEALREYYHTVRPQIWLFPGNNKNHPMNRQNVRLVIIKARWKAGIEKRATTHTMRHSFATHMLEDGVDLRKIQIILGHRYLQTTSKYLHVATNRLHETKNPLDSLEL
jgi:site-specific recombinase XerD